MSSAVAFAALRECRLIPYLCHIDKTFLVSVAVPLSAVRFVAADTSAVRQHPVAAAHYPEASPDGSVKENYALALFPGVLSCPGVLAAKSYLSFHAADLDVPAVLIFSLCAD